MTPGPWHLTETEPGIDADMDVFTMAPRYAGGTALVARVMHADDALVIAAAPELLAAAQATLQNLRSLAIHPSHYAALESAITKATGA